MFHYFGLMNRFSAKACAVFLLVSGMAGLFLTGCGSNGSSNNVIQASGFTEEVLLERLINASDGETIQLGEGEFRFTRSISLDGITGVTLAGSGADKTILSFSGQTDGAEGLMVTADSFTVVDLAIIDAAGDAIKVKGGKDLAIRRVRVGWSDGPQPTNGAYGLYPVNCNGVIIEDCEVSDASDAGIYVGQSENIVVRNNKVHHNVAGIEIENSFFAEVYGNTCTSNTGGILVFDLPELPVKNGHHVSVYKNDIYDNNFPNFAPEGNMVGIVPAGTGVLVMATRSVEVYENKITNHQTFSIAVVSYLINQRPYSDPLYDPYPDQISIHNNTIVRQSGAPDLTRELGVLLSTLFSQDVPEILVDGIVPEDRALTICITNNTGGRLANLDAGHDYAGLSMDPSPYDCSLELERP
jgi:parallel beta-helix repeat protein